MALADQTYILNAIGDPGATNVSTQELTTAANFGDKEVYRRTGKRVWVTGDDDYESAQMAANLFAISMLKRKFPDYADTVNRDFNTAVQIVTDITTEDTDADATDTGTPLIVIGNYNSNPANPDAPYVFATKNRGSVQRNLSDVMGQFL
jgi:hypothetical protein